VQTPQDDTSAAWSTARFYPCPASTPAIAIVANEVAGLAKIEADLAVVVAIPPFATHSAKQNLNLKRAVDFALGILLCGHHHQVSLFAPGDVFL
jgi:hypothetical protein